TGIAELSMGTISLSGTQASDFSISQQPTSPVAVDSSTTFQITFTPSATGTRSAEVSLDTNDEDENPYTFAIQGNGTPELKVYLPLINKS
ncbi:MAG: choice-of-anchor D domain-containing protein, partial [Chloroflexota bacterium]